MAKKGGAPTKSEILTSISKDTELSRKQVGAVFDSLHGIIKKSFEDFGISFDIYHRTSDPVHHETASAFFKTLYDKGVFTEDVSEQYYDEEAQLFLADRYITGTCPNCGNENAYGDQCERCGKSLDVRCRDVDVTCLTWCCSPPIQRRALDTAFRP